MPSRLAVTLCQQAQRNGRRADIEDQLIADILFANGLDASVIHSLEYIALESTDHLCLQGIKGDMALLNWLPATETAALLTHLRIAGRLRPQASDPKATSVDVPVFPSDTSELLARRRFYHFDLSDWPSAAAVMERLKKLLTDMEVKVVPLQWKSSTNQLKNAPNSSLPSSQSPEEKKDVGIPLPTHALPSHPASLADAAKVVSSETSSSVHARDKASEETESNEEDEWSHLDRLVDDLDASSL